MKKVEVRYVTDNNDILMKETIHRWDIPQKGNGILWMKNHWEVASIFENWDEGFVEVTLNRK